MHFLQFANSKNCVSHGQQAWVRFHLLSDIHLVTENSCLAECFFLPSSDEEIYRLCVNLSPPPYIIHFCEALSNGHAFRLGNILDGQFFFEKLAFLFFILMFSTQSCMVSHRLRQANSSIRIQNMKSVSYSLVTSIGMHCFNLAAILVLAKYPSIHL